MSKQNPRIRYFDGKYKVEVTSIHYDSEGEEKIAHCIALEPVTLWKGETSRVVKIGERFTVLDRRIWRKKREVSS